MSLAESIDRLGDKLVAEGDKTRNSALLQAAYEAENPPETPLITYDLQPMIDAVVEAQYQNSPTYSTSKWGACISSCVLFCLTATAFLFVGRESVQWYPAPTVQEVAADSMMGDLLDFLPPGLLMPPSPPSTMPVEPDDGTIPNGKVPLYDATEIFPTLR